MSAAPLVHGEEGAALFAVLKADGEPIGFEQIRQILAEAEKAGDLVGIF